jgi:hypothetical protein
MVTDHQRNTPSHFKNKHGDSSNLF